MRAKSCCRGLADDDVYDGANTQLVYRVPAQVQCRPSVALGRDARRKGGEAHQEPEECFASDTPQE